MNYLFWLFQSLRACVIVRFARFLLPFPLPSRFFRIPIAHRIRLIKPICVCESCYDFAFSESHSNSVLAPLFSLPRATATAALTCELSPEITMAVPLACDERARTLRRQREEIDTTSSADFSRIVVMFGYLFISSGRITHIVGSNLHGKSSGTQTAAGWMEKRKNVWLQLKMYCYVQRFIVFGVACQH